MTRIWWGSKKNPPNLGINSQNRKLSSVYYYKMTDEQISNAIESLNTFVRRGGILLFKMIFFCIFF